ncbi:universal stress protein [Flavobacterium sp. ARAG 55.4]|uniref:Universal stress protein n=1 Tax=Flavobacterium plantiphilum TaxID=3163297 RepID=A0ABW8XW54_9FLAO
MSSKSTIIAATNFSDIAKNAVFYAAALAEVTGSKLLLFHSFSLSIHSSNSRVSSAGLDQELNRSLWKLKILATELSTTFSIEIEIYCIYSPLEEELNKLIENRKIELVVMGMADKSLEQDLMGNSTTSVIKNINIPVLAVPEAAHFSQVKKILFALDDTSLSTVKRFRWFTKIVLKLKSEIEFFSVEHKVEKLLLQQNNADSTIDPNLTDIKHLYKKIKSSDVVNEIKLEIKNYKADLLVMVPQKYGFWDSLLHISKTRTMATGLEIPLLSLPN